MATDSPAHVQQIVKARDDHNPVYLCPTDLEANGELCFSIADGSECSWASSDERITQSVLRSRIEPWLTALFQSEHLSLLAGSGLTHGVHAIAAASQLPGMAVPEASDDELFQAIVQEGQRSAQAAGRDNGNVEDYLRAGFDLLRGLEIRGRNDERVARQAETVRSYLSDAISEFSDAVLAGETNIAAADQLRRERAFNYLVTFMMSFASRSGTRDRLHIFTTNYDRVVEAGADVAGLHLIDRFVGTLEPVFRSSRLDIDIHYNPPGIRGEPRYLEGVARFTKLHGSVDWIETPDAIRRIGLPFGAETMQPYLSAPGRRAEDATQLMVYPNAAKDRETAGYPYVELFRDLASASCRPNHTLVTYGYSFGDEHINRVIEDMLTIPSTHLVVIAYSDPLGRIMRTYERLGKPAQITLLIGSDVANLPTLVDWYLPKPAIDKTTFRMADLLKARWGPAPATESDSQSADGQGQSDA